jgi:tetratricopeptide (TPR) repeat protein
MESEQQVRFMSRVTSLTSMPEAQLNRWIKRIGMLFLVVLVGFIAFYAVDRFRAPAPSITNQKLATLEAQVRTNPADIAARGQLADLYLSMERYPDAITQYTEILSAGKDQEAAYASRGRAYELSGQLDPAKADYQKVVDIAKDGEMANVDTTLGGAYYGLGSVAMQQGRPQDAVDPLTKALVIGPTDADTMNLLGNAYIALNQPEKAITPLRNATAFVPIGWADPYKSLQTAYTKLGKADEATWAGAMVSMVNGDAAAALKALNGIVNGDAKVDAAVGLGLVYETQNDAIEAAAWYAKALAIDPQNSAALLGRGRVGTPGQGSAAPEATASPVASPSQGVN